jgi:molecular chaperone GrpE
MEHPDAPGAAGEAKAKDRPMTTSKRQIPIDDHKSKAGEATAAAPRDPAQAPEAAAAPESGAPAGEREVLLRERDTLADSLLRLRAEFENYRKRASRELAEARERAQGDLLGDLLPVLDNLERALDAAEHHEEGKVLDGVRLTRNQFVDLLARIGVQEIEGLGAPFDPAVHDAILVQPSEHEEGLVAAVLERGYRQGDRVLRPARVIVSAGRAGAEAGGTAG